MITLKTAAVFGAVLGGAIGWPIVFSSGFSASALGGWVFYVMAGAIICAVLYRPMSRR
jgi:zinc transporter ZupT